MRRVIAFACASETLLGTLDEAPGTTGVLIISGGNEIRIGAHRGMALLAARLAAAGAPVFRFDRRGVGDSSGENGGFESAGPDIATAVAAFRHAAPELERVIAFGNCDGASAVLLHGDGLFDAVALANPWLGAETDDLPPAAAIRARYLAQARNPAAWAKLLAGRMNMTNLVNGLRKISVKRDESAHQLEQQVFVALAGQSHARILLATGDATAIAFADAARRRGYRGSIERVDTASHSFARGSDADALFRFIMRSLG